MAVHVATAKTKDFMHMLARMMFAREGLVAQSGEWLGDFYPESERDKWLEQVRPLAQELREDMDDDK